MLAPLYKETSFAAVETEVKMQSSIFLLLRPFHGWLFKLRKASQGDLHYSARSATYIYNTFNTHDMT